MPALHRKYRLARLPAAIALATLVAQAQAWEVAADEQVHQLEKIVVIGVRASGRTATALPAPVDVLSRDDLRTAGAINGELGQALANLLPSFNFPRQSNSGGSDHVRAAQLRGLSPDQVLVLVNGKRFHTSALVNTDTKIGRGTTPVDFNAIPISAIKRVEVLRDGAGAQYGSDAIAGVINIVLDDAADGGEVVRTLGAHRTDVPATRQRITDGNGGHTYARFGTRLPGDGFLNAGVETGRRKATNRAGSDTVPDWLADPTPANLALRGKRNYAAGDPQSENYSGWLNGELPLDANARLYLLGMYARRRTVGANYFRYPDSSANVPAVYPDGYRPESVGRNRDMQFMLGIRGQVAGWDLDGSFNVGGNVFDYDLRRSLNASLGPASPTAFRLGGYRFALESANLDGKRGLAVGDAYLNLAVGGEFRRERFRTRPGDPASYAAGTYAAAPIGAQAGGGLQPQDAARIARRVGAVYAEVSSDLTERVFIDLAARYEHYGDFGGNRSGKLSARWEFVPGFALRGTVSDNFRAPALSQIGFESTTSGYGADGRLLSGRILSVNNPIARGLGARALKPETSRNLSLGLTGKLGDYLDFSLDVYRISVADRVTLSETIRSPGLESHIQRRFGVPGVQSVAFFTNAVDTRTRGAEFVGNYRTPWAGGNLLLTLAYSRNHTDIRAVRATPPELAATGAGNVLFGDEERNTLTDAAPRQRGSFSASWNNRRWSLLGRVTRQGSTVRVFDFGDGHQPRQRHAARWQFDAEAELRLSPRFSLAVGGYNLTDRYPTRSRSDIDYGGNFPYDVISPIGINGRYVYARVRYSFGSGGVEG